MKLVNDILFATAFLLSIYSGPALAGELAAEINQTIPMNQLGSIGKNENKNGFDSITVHFVEGRSSCDTSAIADAIARLQGEGQQGAIFHFFIDQCGSIYPGLSLDQRGAHAGQMRHTLTGERSSLDQHNLGIALIGPSDQKAPNKQIGATLATLEVLTQKFDIQNIFNIETLKRAVRQCQARFIAPPLLKTTLNDHQKSAFNVLNGIFIDWTTNRPQNQCRFNH